MRSGGLSPTKNTPGPTSLKDTSREISWIAPSPVEIPRESLRNRRQIPEDINLKLKLEAISKNPGPTLTETKQVINAGKPAFTFGVLTKEQEKQLPEESANPSINIIKIGLSTNIPRAASKTKRSKVTEIGGWIMWVSIMLFLFLTTPVFGQSLLSPQLDVYDSSGHYSGQPPLIKTISLLEVQECSDVQRTYQDPVLKRVQVLKKLDLVRKRPRNIFSRDQG
jgi:hypothetical protein